MGPVVVIWVGLVLPSGGTTDTHPCRHEVVPISPKHFSECLFPLANPHISCRICTTCCCVRLQLTPTGWRDLRVLMGRHAAVQPFSARHAAPGSRYMAPSYAARCRRESLGASDPGLAVHRPPASPLWGARRPVYPALGPRRPCSAATQPRLSVFCFPLSPRWCTPLLGLLFSTNFGRHRPKPRDFA